MPLAGVITPSSNATNAPNGLYVDPGGYLPFIALFNRAGNISAIRCIFVFIRVGQLILLKSGPEVIANIPPVLGSWQRRTHLLPISFSNCCSSMSVCSYTAARYGRGI
jgi:hypothetical protein